MEMGIVYTATAKEFEEVMGTFRRNTERRRWLEEFCSTLKIKNTSSFIIALCCEDVPCTSM